MTQSRLSIVVLCSCVCMLSASNSHAGSPHLQGGKVNPSQETLASKSAKFGTISASSPAVKKALLSKDLAGGAKLAGRKGAFVGVVTSVYSPKGHAAIYLDFSEPWKNSISGQVNFADYAKFPLLSSLKGKKVLISGTFSIYGKDHPEVMVSSPSQIKLVK